MLIVVKPGMVFTSLTKISPVVADDQEVDARHAGAVHGAERPDRQPLDLARCFGGQIAPG